MEQNIARGKRRATGGWQPIGAGSGLGALVKRFMIRMLVRHSGGGQARGVLRVWPLWERIARMIHPPVLVPGSPHAIFSVRFSRHRGSPVTLSDGVRVRRDDLVG